MVAISGFGELVLIDLLSAFEVFPVLLIVGEGVRSKWLTGLCVAALKVHMSLCNLSLLITHSAGQAEGSNDSDLPRPMI